MLKCSVYIATSVDGFIARGDGGLGWLQHPEYVNSGDEDFGYDKLMSSVDAVVMGRRTFEKVLSFGPWPYPNTPTVVLSGGSPQIPDSIADRIVLRNASPAELVRELSAGGARHVYVDGGITVQRFLQSGLIDTLTITTIPILLGGGVPLFGALDQEQRLRLETSRSYPNGFVQNTYSIIHPS